MTKKEFAIILILGFLAILQVSFAPHFIARGAKWLEWINLVDLAVAVIVLFERRRGRLGWIAALWGGIFLDLYSEKFGFWTVMFLLVTAFVKLFLKRYVRIPSFW